MRSLAPGATRCAACGAPAGPARPPGAAAPRPRRGRRDHAADRRAGRPAACSPSRSTSSSSCSRSASDSRSRLRPEVCTRPTGRGASSRSRCPACSSSRHLTQWLLEARAGATVGNALTGIRTMGSQTHRPAGMPAIAVRVLVELAGALVALVGAWVVVASGAWDRSPARRGWHDKAARTLVLRARSVREAGVEGPGTSPAVARALGAGARPRPGAPCARRGRVAACGSGERRAGHLDRSRTRAPGAVEVDHGVVHRRSRRGHHGSARTASREGHGTLLAERSSG